MPRPHSSTGRRSTGRSKPCAMSSLPVSHDTDSDGSVSESESLTATVAAGDGRARAARRRLGGWTGLVTQ